MPDSSFEAQQKQHMAPRESHGKGAERFCRFYGVEGLLEKARWQFRNPIEICGASEGRDSNFEAQQKQFAGPREVPWQSCWEGFKAFKGCWKRARWQFRSPLETGCGASEVPDSSFEAQQKQLVGPRGPRQSCWESFERCKAFKSAGKGQMAVSKPNRKLWHLGRGRLQLRRPTETVREASGSPMAKLLGGF